MSNESSNSNSNNNTSDSVSSSGYSSDITTTLQVEQDESSYSEFYSGSEDENISQRIAYLQQKQEILTRLSQHLQKEEVYNAFKANMQSHFVEPEIWRRAKNIAGIKNPKPPPSIIIPETRIRPSPKDPAIKLDNIQAITSSACSRASLSDSSFISEVENRMRFDPQQHWIIAALELFHKPLQNTNWSIVRSSAHNAALIPPFAVENQMTLEQAIEITDEARIVAQATPPFIIVYANRALLEMTNDPREVIGLPVERILEVDCREKEGDHLNARIQNKNCHIKVTPVFDQSQRITSSGLMSHIMIGVKDIQEWTEQERKRSRSPTLRTVRSAKRHHTMLNAVG